MLDYVWRLSCSILGNKMKLFVQEYLENNSLASLSAEHGINFRFDTTGRKVSLSYDQIESKGSDPIACSCRGLILRRLNKTDFTAEEIVGPTAIIAYPFNRFFNYGELTAAKIDWQSARVINKIDGTLCVVSFDDITDQWCVSTRSVPEADIPISDVVKYTYRTLFENILEEVYGMSFLHFTSCLRSDYTYCFELVSPFNRIVVDYPKGLFCLGKRNKITGQEEKVSSSEFYQENENKIECPEEYPLTTIDDIIKFVNDRDPIKFEGSVIVDDNFNRIKVKNAAYCAFNRLRDSLSNSKRNCMEIVLMGKCDDCIAFVPLEIKTVLLEMTEGLQKLISKTKQDQIDLEAEAKVIQEANPSFNEYKAFALAVQAKQCWTAPLYEIKRDKYNGVGDFIEKNKKNGEYSSSFLDMILREIEWNDFYEMKESEKNNA